MEWSFVLGETTKSATSSTMASVGVRELRQRASELLRRVEQGETIEITDRGRPVAVLAPLPASGGVLEHLIATGEVAAAQREAAALPPPLKLPPGAVTPSERLRQLRDDER